MRKDVAYQFICLMMCLCTMASVVPGRLSLPCCIDSDCCIMSSAELAGMWAGVRPAILRCEVAVGSTDGDCDSAHEACRDCQGRKFYCQLCQSLVFLPTYAYDFSCLTAVQPYVSFHDEPPLCEYLQAVFRPPRS